MCARAYLLRLLHQPSWPSLAWFWLHPDPGVWPGVAFSLSGHKWQQDQTLRENSLLWSSDNNKLTSSHPVCIANWSEWLTVLCLKICIYMYNIFIKMSNAKFTSGLHAFLHLTSLMCLSLDHFPLKHVRGPNFQKTTVTYKPHNESDLMV